jgi:hypothetical protein
MWETLSGGYWGSKPNGRRSETVCHIEKLVGGMATVKIAFLSTAYLTSLQSCRNITATSAI